MLLQQHVQETQNKKISDEESLVWCYRNANTEWNNAINALEIILNLCSCSAQEVNFMKIIRSQINYVSDQLTNKSYQSPFHSTNGSNSNDSSIVEEMSKTVINEIEILKNLQILLRKKFRLMSIMRKELIGLKCDCFKNWNNININRHLKKSEFNCKMWFRQIKLIEAKIKCNRQLIPFDLITIARELLENNELSLNSINVDINNNNDIKQYDIKNEKIIPYDDSNGLTENHCSYSTANYSHEYENSFIDMRNMQTLKCDSLISAGEESSSFALQSINSNDMTTNTEMDCEVRTFQELHPISNNIGLNYSEREISVFRSNASSYQEFDYNNDNNQDIAISIIDLLPQITTVEIDQILNN